MRLLGFGIFTFGFCFFLSQAIKYLDRVNNIRSVQTSQFLS